MQHKILQLNSAGVKFDGQNPRIFEGYASVFGGVDSYGDMIMPGAYAETLKEENRNGRDIKMRWNHYGPVIGKWLEMYEDDKGLYVKGELTPGHSVAGDVAASMQHKAVDGLSIGYWIDENGYDMEGPIRRLKKINLMEISVVEEPADTMARVDNVKALVDNVESLKDAESLLREACGFSRTDATALVGRIKSLSHGERGGEPESQLKAEFSALNAEFSALTKRLFG